MAVSHPAVVLDDGGTELARGSAGNISETGVFIVARLRTALPENRSVTVEMEVPQTDGTAGRGGRTGTVRFRGRIVRTVNLGQLFGLGIRIAEECEE